MAATAAAAELGAFDGNHLNASAAQKGVGVDIAIVTNDHAGFDSNNVVTVVPLFAYRSLKAMAVPPGRRG